MPRAWRSNHRSFLEKNHRSVEEHLRNSTKELQLLQPAYQLQQGPSLNVAMLTHIPQGINKRSWRCTHTCRPTISLASWRCGGMVPMLGVLTITGKEDEEQVSPPTSMSSWRAWRSTWGWVRSWRVFASVFTGNSPRGSIGWWETWCELVKHACSPYARLSQKQRCQQGEGGDLLNPFLIVQWRQTFEIMLYPK